MPCRSSLGLTLCALLALVLSPVTAQAEEVLFERWFVALMDGNRAGYMHSRVREADDRISTESNTVLEIKRGRVAMTISVESQFVETRAGEPISARTKMNMGAMGAQDVRWTFKDRTRLVQETVTPIGTSSEELTLAHGDWLTPGRVREHTMAQLKAGAKVIEYASVDPTHGAMLVTVTQEILEETTVEALGRSVPALRCRSTMSIMPGVQTLDYVDPLTGEPIRTDLPLGAITITMLAADRELALSQVEPTELMLSTLVTPDKPIRRPRQTKRAVYILSLSEGEEQIADLPTTAAQTATRLEDGRIRVEVDLNTALPEDDPKAAESALNASPFIDSNDPLIVELAQKATKGASDDTRDRAEAIRRFVYNFVSNKSLDVGFASASETARTRVGDCTEHSVLMAAMLRADGISARLASGLIYADQFLGADGVFGYHMWVQALLADEEGVMRWVDFDPAMPSRFDATHILLSTSILDSTQATPANDMVVLVPLLGRLQIEVVEVK